MNFEKKKPTKKQQEICCVKAAGGIQEMELKTQTKH